MGFSVKLYPRAYRDLDGIYQRAYENTGDAGEMLPWLECLEEGILGLRDSPFWPRTGKAERLLGGRYQELQAGRFGIVFQVSAREGQVKVVTVREL